jgi:ribosome-associated toxin RatA of RatAB toxin-antitoxin module
VKVEVRRRGRRFEAEAMLELAADAQTVWDTITDYHTLASFMPGIHSCRVIERRTPTNGVEHLLVEQHGEFRFMLFTQAMTLRLNIEHRLHRVAEARAVSFDLGLFRGRAIDVFEGRYELMPHRRCGSEPQTQLRYAAVIGLRLPPPPAVGSIAVRQNLVTQLQAIAKEVARLSRRSKTVLIAP